MLLRYFHLSTLQMKDSGACFMSVPLVYNTSRKCTTPRNGNRLVEAYYFFDFFSLGPPPLMSASKGSTYINKYTLHTEKEGSEKGEP
jgi:hypothetical protein